MTTRAIQRKVRMNRVISICIVYALLLQEFIPFARAMETIEFHQTAFKVKNTFWSEMSVNADVEKVDEIESLISEALPEMDEAERQQVALAVAAGGPGQSESSGFSLGSTDGMVDKFTGDFTYSIPLMNVEGYPIVINYNSNIGMNAEASWVGLGWDLNVGSVSREMRGLPDEFNGDQRIVKQTSQLNNTTSNGFKVGGYAAYSPLSSINGFYPSVQLTLLTGQYDNSYLGRGRTMDIGLQSSLSISDEIRFGTNFGFGFSVDTKNGIGTNSSIGLNAGSNKLEGLNGLSLSYGRNYNSRQGLVSQSIGLGVNGSYSSKHVNPRIRMANSTSLTYGSITSLPRISLNGVGSSEQFGGEIFFQPSDFKFGFISRSYNSNSSLDYTNSTKEFYQPAFGYLHSGKRSSYNTSTGEYPVMDFNRTNDFEFSERQKNLAFSFQTYDIFRASAMGMSGTFRARRNDVGTYHDPGTNTLNEGKSDDVNAGFTAANGPDPASLQIGYARGSQTGTSNSGKWQGILEFNQEVAGNNFDQTVYFKSLGEMTPDDQSALGLLADDTPAFIDVNRSGDVIAITNDLKHGNTTTPVVSSTVNAANGRPVISTYFTPKTAEQTSVTSPTIPAFTENQFGPTATPTGIGRTASDREANHISSVEILSNDGMEYIYGIPAYNISSSQVTFAVGDNTTDPLDTEKKLVRYDAGDNSIANTKGRGHYFDKTTTPAYAHSFLLTEMHSSDYVDISGDGPSVDDVGSYYQINHTRVYGPELANGNYKWRYPISDDQGNQAFYNEGFEGTELDNTANYAYGEKEIWYTHSIESKNFVAEFYLEDREDAYGVLDENGQINVNQPLRLLKKIVLYNRSERNNNTVDPIPLQTVEFFYDYSLCKGNPANKNTYISGQESTSGKLTLKEIRVSSGNSLEGGLSTYQFEYSATNPDFNYAATDAWGNYKPNDGTKPNTIFPYAEQNETSADQNIQAWKLVAINNPMGGRVEIEYEADRYVSVQNRRSMHHFDVHLMTNLFELLHLKGESSWDGSDRATQFLRRSYSSKTDLINDIGDGYSWTGAASDQFYRNVFTKKDKTNYTAKFGKFDKEFIPNNVIIFKLQGAIPSSTTEANASQLVKDQYFRIGGGSNAYVQDLYLKMHLNLKPGVNDYVPLFAKISEDYIDPFGGHLPFEDNFTAIGVMPPSPGGDYEYGYVVLDPANTGAREKKNNNGDDQSGELISPIQRSGLDFARQNLPDKVYGSCVGCDPDLSADVAALFSGDMYKYLIDEGGYVPTFINDYSTVRLFIPDDVKYGGNARVSKITYKDNWNTISGEYDSEYSWFYSYAERTDETGVASWEPAISVDENPFYYWSTYVNARKLFPDETKFTPTPVTGALFPIPTVGYADVRVRFSGGITQGFSKAEFFTAADVPTIERMTPLEKSEVKKRNILTGSTTDLYGMTQGFVIITNDFHGKPKEFTTLNSLSQIQSRSTYIYDNLGQKVNMIDRKGNVSEENIAMEYDVHADARFITDASTATSIGLNLRFTLPAFFPFYPIPVISATQRQRGFFSHALVKHLNQNAVLNRIETEYLNSINTAENLLYDKYTGNVLLSSLTDEYEDKLYSMSYPSHWRHEELRDVCSVLNREYNVSITGDDMNYALLNEPVFTPGDRIQITVGANSNEAVILTVDGTTAELIDPTDGTNYSGLTGNAVVTILKSGRNNRLMESMQSTTTKKEVPVAVGTFAFPEQEILSCSAISYRNKNNVRCRPRGSGGGENPSNNEVEEDQPVNPFDYGAKGDLVLDGQYAWQSERKNFTANHGTRFDGEYTTFIPYYKMDGSNIWRNIEEAQHPDHITTNTLQNWRKLGEVTRYDEYGKALESEDQIDVHSAVLYGFNKELALLPVAQAVNARQQEIAYDGFEDYSYYQDNPLNNFERHFDFADEVTNNANVSVNGTIRHSGLSSLELNPGGAAEVQKEVDNACTNVGDGITNGQFIAEECLCVLPFKPTPGDYVIGAWAKLGNDATVTDYSDAKIEVTITVNGTPQTVTITPKGTILDGWQRMEGEFTIPLTGATVITVRLINGSSTQQVYFDDLRIHPFLAGMTTTVYDPKTLLPFATHDGYNFTTYYNYDENLNQVRVRVETIEGIKTISETEFGGQKRF